MAIPGPHFSHARRPHFGRLLAHFISENRVAVTCILSLLLLLLLILLLIRSCTKPGHTFESGIGEGNEKKEEVMLAEPPPANVLPDVLTAVRPAPERFEKNKKMPSKREISVSGAINLDKFSPARDLVYVADTRCWWESDNDTGENDTEDDHSMHAAAELPFRRLVNLAQAAAPELMLCVQEAYRPAGIHAAKSLHCEGRALDLTFERRKPPALTWGEKEKYYELLAKLAWQAGFDWVYFEFSSGTGPHIHASVKSSAERLGSEPTGLPSAAMLPHGTVLPEKAPIRPRPPRK